MSIVSLNSKTQIVGILGWPVSHSVSPQMHNAAFAHLGVNFAYIALPCAPEGLGQALLAFKALGFAGANITIPHKERVFDHLDHISELSLRSGSVNTLYLQDGKLCGTTTDGLGALSHMESQGFDLNSKHVIVLGNGGSAKSIAHALAHSRNPQKITICGRDESKAQSLLDSLSSSSIPVDFHKLSDWDRLAEENQVIIHTTPLGMHPNISDSPLAESQILPSHTVYDIVYNPRQTQLLKNAQSAGAKALGGLGMLVHQGALSQELWTGQKAPTEIMFEAAERALA